MNCYYTGISPCEIGALYKQIWRKARKDHICDECNRIIKKKEEYEYVSLLNDGSFNVYKTCLGCARLRGDIDCRCHGILDEIVQDWLGISIWEDRNAFSRTSNL